MVWSCGDWWTVVGWEPANNGNNQQRSTVIVGGTSKQGYSRCSPLNEQIVFEQVCNSWVDLTATGFLQAGPSVFHTLMSRKWKIGCDREHSWSTWLTWFYSIHSIHKGYCAFPCVPLSTLYRHHEFFLIQARDVRRLRSNLRLCSASVNWCYIGQR